MALFTVVLAVLMLQGLPGDVVGSAADAREQQSQHSGAQSTAPLPPVQPPDQQQPAQQAPRQPTAPPRTAPRPSTTDDVFSIERLREELERKPTITFVVPDSNVPRFKVEVEGKRWELPSLQTRLANAIPRMPVQVPFGGTMASDMARLNTPPEFFGSAPFTNGDLLKMEALSGAYGLAGALIKRAIEARQGAEAAQVREQIRQELVAIDQHNARIAAGQSDDDAPPKKVDKDKKKPVVKKKKQ